MTNILNITNGDCTVSVMKKAKIPGVFLPWQDVLHDGPVPAERSLVELSDIRADFISRQGWGKTKEVKQAFTERNHTLNSFEQYEKVILWFEHDLYDQLQLLQILDWFYHNNNDKTRLTMICRDQYLGTLSTDQILALMQFEEPVTEQHLLLASKAWSAFRDNSPKKWHQLLETSTAILPFLEGAIIRMLEEYPDINTGLSRTASQALQTIKEGALTPVELFNCNQQLEDRIYLGDASFWLVLHELLNAEPALIQLSDGKKIIIPSDNNQKITITQAGLDISLGNNHWLNTTRPNRWIGGVHLEPGNVWCWDSACQSIIKYNE